MAKEVFERTKPHVNVGSGCLAGARWLVVGILLPFLALVGAVVYAEASGQAESFTLPGNLVITANPDGAGGDPVLAYDPTCPQGAPFRCDDGSCVLTPSMCDPGDACPPDMPLMCVDGQCVAEPGDCDVFPDCPGVTPYQCPDGACEPHPSYCEDLPVTSSDPDDGADPVPPPPSQCPEDWFICSDGSCAVTRDECPQPPPAPEEPPPPQDEPEPQEPSGDGGDSDDGSGDGGDACPSGQFQCPDGSCVRTPSACEEPPSPGGPGDLTS